MKFKYLISIVLIALLSNGSLNAEDLKSCSDQWNNDDCDNKPKGKPGHDACYKNWDNCLKNNIDNLDKSNATCKDKMQQLAKTLM